MLRAAAILVLVTGLQAGEAVAGQATGVLSVGITIGGGTGQKPAAQSSATYTWGAAAVSLERAGFGSPQRVAKSDTLYWFEAERSGVLYRVGVSISSGEIVEVNPA